MYLNVYLQCTSLKWKC